MDNLYFSNKTARIGAWVSNKLKYTRNEKLEQVNQSVIALTISRPNK